MLLFPLNVSSCAVPGSLAVYRKSQHGLLQAESCNVENSRKSVPQKQCIRTYRTSRHKGQNHESQDQVLTGEALTLRVAMLRLAASSSRERSPLSSQSIKTAYGPSVAPRVCLQNPLCNIVFSRHLDHTITEPSGQHNSFYKGFQSYFESCMG